MNSGLHKNSHLLAPSLAALTVILTVKGRDNYTNRFLTLLDYKVPESQRLRVFLAEYRADPNVTAKIESGKYTKLDISRRAYGEVTLTDYYTKIRDSLNEVSTPFVMLCDNDDIPQLGGLLECVEFLLQNEDYVGCIGEIPTFALFDKKFRVSPNGPFSYIISDGKVDRQIIHDLESDSPFHRVTTYFKNGTSLHYAVWRRPLLTDAWERVCEADPWLHLCELFVAIQLLLRGRFKVISESTSYARQVGTSSRHGYLQNYDGYFWTEKFFKSLDCIYKKIMSTAKTCGVPITLELLEQSYASHYRIFTHRSSRLGNLRKSVSQFRSALALNLKLPPRLDELKIDLTRIVSHREIE